MGKVVDKLPTWAKVIFHVFVAVVSLYCIRQYGLGSFLLRVIFGP